RIARIHHEVDRAGLVVDEQNLLPGLAAVSGLEDAAIGVRREHMPHRCGIHDVRVVWSDYDLAGRARIFQTGIFPGLAAVDGLVDAVAGDHVVADVGLASADIEDFGVRGCHRNGADAIARRRKFAVGDVVPHNSVIRALPDAPIDTAYVKQIAVARNAGYRDHTAADVRTDAAPGELAIEKLMRSRGMGGNRDGRQRGERCDPGFAGEVSRVGW